MTQPDNGAGQAKRADRWQRRLLLLVLLFLLLLLLFLLLQRKPGVPPVVEKTAPAVDSQPHPPVAEIDTVAAAEADAPDTAFVKIPPMRKPVQKKQPDTVPAADTLRTSDSIAGCDSSAAVVPSSDSAVAPIVGGCGGDTAQLWVYPDPSGGIHYREVQVRFIANRPATIHYRFKDNTAWTRYEDLPVVIAATTTLFFDAIDTCGNVMERREEYYEIDKSRIKSPCRPDMEQVKVGTMDFCIDRYEWPNFKGAQPLSYVSFYQAADSCFSKGKRLCTAEEWMIACAGPYTWKYPYGQRYEPHACVTHDTTTVFSGSKPECRTFFGAFDMSGNLLEWTDTRAIENSAFIYVMGGFWESGPKSACRDKRYSYYPQNRHNPVGFRCCMDVKTPAAETQGGKR